jgi:N-acetylglucosamine kinase-like BadF-type ATPase
MRVTLIADSGATKCEWCLLVDGKKKKTILTDGLSPYFLSAAEITLLLQKNLLPKIKNFPPKNIFFYGTGLANPANAKVINKVLRSLFNKATIEINHDLIAAARGLCGNKKGIACILGTGANAGFYNGKKIAKNSPGLGYILGDEGSGAYLGKKVIQYYLYNTFDEDLMSSFNKRFNTNKDQILNHVYKEPLANRYLANFAIFLSENRGHYMIENIIEDGLNDFFFTHLYKFKESWSLPINFVGSVAYGFKDVLKELCHTYELELGSVLKAPMEGLITYHK